MKSPSVFTSIPAVFYGWLAATAVCTLPFAVYSTIADSRVNSPTTSMFSAAAAGTPLMAVVLMAYTFLIAGATFIVFGLPYLLVWSPERMLRRRWIAIALPIVVADVLVVFIFKEVWGTILTVWGIAFATVHAAVTMWIYLERVRRVLSRS
jgi:hypothetical protein